MDLDMQVSGAGAETTPSLGAVMLIVLISWFGPPTAAECQEELKEVGKWTVL